MAERLTREVEEPGVFSDHLDDRALRGKRRRQRPEDRAGPPHQWRTEGTYIQHTQARFTWFLLGTWAVVQVIGFTLMATLPADAWERVQSALLYVMGGSLSLVVVAIQYWFSKRAKK